MLETGWHFLKFEVAWKKFFFYARKVVMSGIKVRGLQSFSFNFKKEKIADALFRIS